MRKETYKIIFVPIISIVIISIIFTYSDKFILKSYHEEIIKNFTEFYKKDQYNKIKTDVSRIINTINYIQKTYNGDINNLEGVILDRITQINMTDMPYTFILKVLNIDGGEKYAKVIFYNNNLEKIGKVISSHKQDIDNKKFLEKVVQEIKKQGYSYVIYKHLKPNSNGLNKKLTYFCFYKPLNWIITSSIYLDEIDAVIKEKDIFFRTQVDKLIKKSLKIIIFFTFLVGLISYFVSKNISNRINSANEALEIQKTKAEQAARELEIMASRDFLTGLYNRRSFFDLTEKALHFAKRQNSNLSCLMIDIDKFKQINDKFGHSTGDMVLKSLATILTEKIRSSDIVARYGGEEFVVFLQNTDTTDAQVIAEKIRKEVESKHLQINGIHISYTISIGISQFNANNVSTTAIIDKADKALYDAKAGGRNRVATATDS